MAILHPALKMVDEQKLIYNFRAITCRVADLMWFSKKYYDNNNRSRSYAGFASQ